MKRQRGKYQRGKYQHGSSLLEVMIGLFILAIGLLGMSSLQNRALRENNNAYFYTQAVFLVSDITERIRANRNQLSDYGTEFSEVSVTTTADCQANNCGSSAMAKWDLKTWKIDVVDLLPQGKAEIIVNGNSVTATVEFDDSGGENAATAVTMNTVI